MGPKSFSYESMGSRWEVTTWDDVADETWGAVRGEVVAASNDFDEAYSRFKKTSLVWKLAEQPGTHEVPRDLTAMLHLYQKLHEPTDGKLNPLIGFTISDLGYDDAYTLVPKERVRETPDFSSLRILDDTHVELTEPALIDLGALGKGYFVDRIGAMLNARGIESYLVDGSGDILHRGPSPIAAGLEHPGDATKVIGKIAVQNGALCASGTNRRRWADLHHVIDPTTGTSTCGITATWALAESAAMADGLASCLFFADPETLRTQFPFEYCVLYDDFTVSRSAGFSAELF
jgi:FAD:protein FMN transferase